MTVTNGPVIVGSLYGNGNQGCVNLTSVNGASIPEPPSDVLAGPVRLDISSTSALARSGHQELTLRSDLPRFTFHRLVK